MSGSLLNNFIKYDTTIETPLVTVDFSMIEKNVDEVVYKNTLMQVISTCIQVSKTRSYNVVMFVKDIDVKANYFSDSFVSDLTKTFLAKEFTSCLETLNIYDSPKWLYNRINTMCDTLYRNMRKKVKFVECI